MRLGFWRAKAQALSPPSQPKQAKEGGSTKKLIIGIDEELLQLLEKEAKKLNIDVSTYVGWCIRTGLSLKDLNRFIRSRSEESE